MAYIFMDESGDLGFDFTKQKTSRYFVIAFLMLEDQKIGNKIVEKVIKGMSKTERKRNSGVLHFYQLHPKVRFKVLGYIAQMKCSAMTIYLDKKTVYTYLQNEKHVLYNYVTNILLDRIVSKKLLPKDDLHLIVAKRETNKFLNHNFQEYLTQKGLQNHNINITISIEPYHKSTYKCLQLVDAVSWTVFRKREHQDDSYYQVIKDTIVEESKLFG